MAVTIKPKVKKHKVYDVLKALYEQMTKYGSWEYYGEPEKFSMLAGVILPDDPKESPYEYFDFSGYPYPDEILKRLEDAPLLQSFAPKRAINMQKRLIEKFPRVKHA